MTEVTAGTRLRPVGRPDFVNITYTHRWLVLAVCVAVLLRSRREIAAAPLGFRSLALLGLVGRILAWLVCIAQLALMASLALLANWVRV